MFYLKLIAYYYMHPLCCIYTKMMGVSREFLYREKVRSMGESNTVVSAYTMYRNLQQYCSHP